MDCPPKVVRSQDGTISDSHGRPVIIIFDSKPNHTTRHTMDSDDTGQQEGTQNDIQPLEFINEFRTAQENTVARRMIRTHVMRNHLRQRKQEIRDRAKNTVQVSLEGRDTSFRRLLLPPQPSGSLDPFAQYPIQMKPRTLTDGISDKTIFLVTYLTTAEVIFSFYIHLENLSNFLSLNSV
jgi:hypothetical protein